MSIPNFLTQAPIPSLVDNKVFQTSQTYDVIDVSDPTGRRVLHQVSSLSSLSEVTQVVNSSSLAFQKWRWSSISTRRSIFEKAQSILKSRLEEYAKLTMEETTMSKNMAGLDLKMGLEQMNEASHVLAQALKSEMAPVEDETNERQMIVREPFGVILGMAPFNFPFNLAMRAVLCAILAGNTTILKTSEYSPRTHLYVAQILYEAGLPPGVLNVIHISTREAPMVVEKLIAQPSVRKINFTGSARVGKIINKVAAEYLKPCVLELGGKAPMIVMKNADLDLASNQILFSSLANQGQVCMSGATILAHKSISEDLKKRIQKIFVENKDKFEAKREGNSDSSKHHIRSLFCSASGEKAKKIYEDAISKGAEVFAGNPSFDGALIQPVYLSNVTREMEVFKEEVFAPVVGMVEFETTEEAIELANFNETALSSAIFCKDESEAFKLARRIESGAVHINGSTIHDNPFVPHGGIKSSGFGRFNGMWGLHEFTNLKVISISDGAFVPYEVM